ncbi:MAG TPA: aminodeoxychorismate synthase component I, partial [Gemmatimonadaceae bacterium]
VFLDSVRDPERLGRYSFLAADPQTVVRGKGTLVESLSLPGGDVTRLESNALGSVRSRLAPFMTAPVPGLPPFQGGAAGYIGYDWGAVLERFTPPRYDDLGIPDVMLGIYDWVVAWDHAERRCWVISTGMPELGDSRAKRATARLQMVKARLAGDPAWWSPVRQDQSARATSATMAPSYPVSDVHHAQEIGLRSSFTHDDYLDAVTRVRDYIVAGDIFQANISQRLEAPLREDAWTLYRRLRELNPAPFAAYLDMDGARVLSASPERFILLDVDGAVEARPIKGTRPRGMYPEHDAALGRALSESMKDRAENLMIVDLLRNDISRVCASGSVRVPDLFALEHYSTVHHLVSTVTGELEHGRDAVDLLTATFPGGSITGAPKVRAMEIIAELEPSCRGVYCGSIGYLSLTGALDTSIVIRTYLVLGERVYFSVGGGIVADSDPEEEYRETLDKARALIAALAAGE